MVLKNRKEKKLYLLFLRYLGIFSAGVAVSMCVFIFAVYQGLNSGILLQANYAEREINRNREIIKESVPFDKDSIPFTCTYGLFDKELNYMEGNFEEKDIQAVLNNKLTQRYMVIEREDGICVIKYDVTVHFSSPKIHNLISNPESFIMGLFIVWFFVLLFITAIRCSKKVKTQLAPLVNATFNIKNKELKFDIDYSEITEFNDVLRSIDDMKSALEESLKKQWKQDENKKTYISALAHDIKTPLTIIKGNAELIAEEEISEEVSEYIESINKNCDRIQEYIRLLIDGVKSSDALKCNFKKIPLKELIDEVIKYGNDICSIKNIDFQYNFEDKNHIINCDKSLLLRAIVNLIDNAAQHSEDEGKITMTVSIIKDMMYMVIDDFGCGFSEEALKSAKEQFFTEKSSRSGKHYGLGMYIADTVVENHGGKLQYIDKEREKGARVWIEMPVSHC